MRQSDSLFFQPFPQAYIVHPPVKAMRVPVLRDPAQGDAVLAVLRAGTAVQVVGRTTLWLEIELPGGQRGFIQEAYARPATPEEALAAQAAGAAGTRRKPQGPILSVEAGLVRPRRRASFGCAYSAFGLAFFACVGGVLLYSVERQECTYPAGSCVTLDHPLAVGAYVLVLAGFLAFCAAVTAWVVTAVRAYRGRAR